MNNITAKIIADSKNTFNNRITTMLVTFPRYILAELNTHRMFSRNSASSRAIPFKKMVEAVHSNPFVPMAWQADHTGMQGTQYITNPKFQSIRRAQWLAAKDKACASAWELHNDWGIPEEEERCPPVTKQMVNRLLEPFMYHTALITATEWENFFHLRCPHYEVAGVVYRSRKDARRAFNADKEGSMSGIADYDSFNWFLINKGAADIHIMALAEAMWDALNESTAIQLEFGEWHIPFGEDINPGIAAYADEFATGKYPNSEDAVMGYKLKVSTARCARTSYTVPGVEGKEHSFEDDVKLHDRLAASGHWSPFEHCGRAMNEYEYEKHVNGVISSSRGSTDGHGHMISIDNLSDIAGWSGNFRGFIQYRKTFPNENITTANKAG